MEGKGASAGSTRWAAAPFKSFLLLLSLSLSLLLLLLLCHVMVRNRLSLSMGRGVLLLEPIPALSLGEGRVLPGQVTSSSQGLTDEQCGAQYLAQGHFDMQLSPAWIRNLNQRPYYHYYYYVFLLEQFISSFFDYYFFQYKTLSIKGDILYILISAS